jgi:hypothetical protein
MFVNLPNELNSVHISVAVRTTGSGNTTIREETENNFDTAAILLLFARTRTFLQSVLPHGLKHFTTLPTAALVHFRCVVTHSVWESRDHKMS